MANDYDLKVEVAPPAQLLVQPMIGLNLDVADQGGPLALAVQTAGAVQVEIAALPVKLVGEGTATVPNPADILDFVAALDEGLS